MDKRCQPRFATEQTVAITTLGEHHRRQMAKVKNTSESGLGLLVDTEIRAGTALRIELEDAILLGEVMYCRPVEGKHFVGVQLEQMLRGLSELHERSRVFEEQAEIDRKETR